MADDFYLILGIDSDASPPAIRRAYLVRARECHPDKCSDADAPQKFQALSNAYAVLSDEAKRNQYDSHRRNRNSNNGNNSDDTFVHLPMAAIHSQNSLKSGGRISKWTTMTISLTLLVVGRHRVRLMDLEKLKIRFRGSFALPFPPLHRVPLRVVHRSRYPHPQVFEMARK